MSAAEFTTTESPDIGTGSIAGLVGGVVAAVAVVLICIGCAVYYKNKCSGLGKTKDGRRKTENIATTTQETQHVDQPESFELSDRTARTNQEPYNPAFNQPTSRPPRSTTVQGEVVTVSGGPRHNAPEVGLGLPWTTSIPHPPVIPHDPPPEYKDTDPVYMGKGTEHVIMIMRR